MIAGVKEDTVEQATLGWFDELGYSILYGPDIEPEKSNQEREAFSDVVLIERLRTTLEDINPDVPSSSIDDAIRKLLITESPNLYENNRIFQTYITEGTPVEYQKNGRTIHKSVKVFDFDNVDNNDWLALNQYTVIENNQNRRPDVVVFVNGLPLGVIELKNPTDEDATLKSAYNQLQTYKNEISSLFVYNEALVISDGIEAKVGSLTADWDRFMPWRTIDGEFVAPKGTPELETLIKGIFDKERFLDIIRFFTVFETDGSIIIKKVAAYHQYHAVNKAVECTVKASSPKGDKRVGVVWHTQGSGKSLSMAFYAGKIIQNPEMKNPTLVVLTDRNDLDDQLYDTFAHCQDLLRQAPVQADNRSSLRDLLKVASGGIVFSTIQKFHPANKGEDFPILSKRRNIVFIADEAHRSQYGFDAKVVTDKKTKEAHITYGFAKYVRDALPNASFIGFTGTPIELADKNTPAVFGDYIDIYDIERAVEDCSTVRIYYEGRLAKIELNEAEKPLIDPEFEDVTEDEEESSKEKLKSKWARLEALVGADKRVRQVANDIVEHFENRDAAMEGKCMIVCMSRRICVDLYEAITKLRPKWHDEDDKKGLIKVVMTGSASDTAKMQPHIRNKKRRKELATRFKDPKKDFKLVIVRDMWLTGFDAPSLHTMYVDKPMRGHGLMQAIARVNRVFKDKQGGLVVDYIGIADQLKTALSAYTKGDRRNTGIPQEEAVAILIEKYEIICDMFHGFDWSKFHTGTPAECLYVIPEAMEHILNQEDGKERYIDVVNALTKAFSLASTHEEAIKIRDDIAFFQAVKAQFVKHTTSGKSPEELDTAIRQIISKAVTSDEVVDIFAKSGLKKPDISILSDEFLAEMKGMKQKNLALELLKKLLNDEIKTQRRKNLVQARSFAEMLERTIRRYQNRTLEAAQVIMELINLAKEMREAHRRGEDLGMTEDELAFYDALEVNDSAVRILGDETLRQIARELLISVRNSMTIDWTVKESVRAKMRVMVKRILKKYGYPPDKQPKAIKTVMEQAELICHDMAA